jgi:hypothetical protein
LAQKKASLLIGLAMAYRGAPMLLQGQEVLTFDNFSFPTPPLFNWTLASANAGFLQLTSDLIALRTNRGGRTRGLLGTASADVRVVSNTTTSKVVVMQRTWTAVAAARDLTAAGSARAVHGAPTSTSTGADTSSTSTTSSRSESVLALFNLGDQPELAFQFGGVAEFPNGDWEVLFDSDSRSYSSLNPDSCKVQRVVRVHLGGATVCIPPLSLVLLANPSSTTAEA